MSTILGTLIFVGIVFTCVIPLFLYVNQVNSLYEQEVVGMRRVDQDQEGEQIDVYAYPLYEPSDNLLNVYIKNKCPLSVRIVRVWVNDKPFEFSFEIPAMGEGIIESIDIYELLETGAFNIKVTTDRGNTFSSLTNTLYYTEGSGWSGGLGLTIQIVIESEMGGLRFYHIVVTRSGDEEYSYEADAMKGPQESSCFTVVTVPVEDTYHVTVNYGALTPIPSDVTFDLSQNSQWTQWVYVYED